MMKRRTVKEKIKYRGIGLHKGEDITMVIRPAQANTGIIIKRVDLQEGKNEIKVAVDNTFDLNMGTNLKNEHGAFVHTIEHLMSALYIMGLTDIIIEIDGIEIPIIDGSARVFFDLIEDKVIDLEEDLDEIVITKPVYVAKGDKYVIGLPYDGFKVTYAINFNHSFLKSQLAEFEVNKETYCQEISKARTFGFDYEVEYLKANNLALGASLDNAICVTKTGVLNPDGLRYEDEFVRHKMLDLIGDLKLIGQPIKGHIIAVKAGHALHNMFARELLAVK